MFYSNLKPKSPYFITGFGVVLFLIAATHHATELSVIDESVGPVVAFLLDGLPALGLAYAGYWLTESELSTKDRWQVWVWCVAGAILFLTIMGLSILVRAFEGRVIGEALFPLLIATEAGGIAGVVGGYQTARARTETRRAKSASDALRERTRQLQAVLDGVEAAIWIRDTDSRFMLVNQSFRTSFDIDEETEVAGKLPDEVVPQEVAEEFCSNDQQVLETEQSVEMEETIETDQGQRTFLTRISPLFEDGDLYATCGIASDITEQKEYERTIEQQNERLNQFASLVSHDLRNPLMVALARLDIIRDTAPAEHVDTIERNLERMEEMIDELLTLARLDQQSKEVDKVALAGILEDAWDHTDAPDCVYESSIPATATVEADRNRLLQIFENLFRNAADHNDSPVTVRVGLLSDDDSDISDGQRTGVYVADNGTGIPVDQRGEIFDRGHTTSVDGTGFGLSIVRDIVEEHGWSISVCDSRNGGARFEITEVNISH